MLLLLFEFVIADTTLSSLTGSSIINTQYSQTSTCLCDLTLGYCDIFCCCDSQCPSTQTQIWDLQQKCSNNYYAGLYSIPECNLQTQKSYLDLYSGLRIAYNLIKRLGCLYSFSILTDTVKQSIFKNLDQLYISTPIINSLTQQFSTQSTDRINYMTQVTASYSSQLYLSNSQFIVQAVQGSPYCRKKLVRNYTNYNSQTCYYNGQSSNSSDLLNSTSVRNYDITDDTNQVYGVTNSNVTYIIGKIYYMSLPTNTTSTQLQTISSDQFANQQSQSIKTFFSGLYFNGSGVYQTTGRNGYDRKSLIRFLKTQNNEIPLPLRLPLVNADGSCSNVSSQPSLLNEIYIQFMVNQQITCSGNTNFGDAFGNQVQYVAKYADSDPNQLTEWIQLSNNSTGQYVELDFYISAYGKQGQQKYQINNVLLQISQLTTQLDSYSHINIRFLDASLPYVEYKAPGPQVINNIPNKIIAPFA